MWEATGIVNRLQNQSYKISLWEHIIFSSSVHSDKIQVKPLLLIMLQITTVSYIATYLSSKDDRLSWPTHLCDYTPHP